MPRKYAKVMLVAVLAITLLPLLALADPPAISRQYERDLIRISQDEWGLSAPVPAFAGQIHQESGWHADVTAADDGKGLAQYMDATAKFIYTVYPQIGKPDPYDPRWAMNAMVHYDKWLCDRVKGDTFCQRLAAALKAYNSGLAYVQKAQRKSTKPGVWFGITEKINAGQSAKNFEYSRLYPRWILFKHQPLYADWGTNTCQGENA